MSYLRVAQLNTRASQTAWHMAEIAAYEKKVDIFLIQDPPLRPENYKWRGFSLVLPWGATPLVAIQIREGIKFRPDRQGGTRVVGAVVYARGCSIAFVSAYIRHTNGEGAGELTRALMRASSASDSTFLGADCNGHSPLWGPQGTRTDVVGGIVEGVLGESGLLVLNSINAPATFRSDAGQESWIDISAASPALVCRIAEWGVHPDVEVGSDHRLILTTVEFEADRMAARVTRNWRKVDWREFNRVLFSTLDWARCQEPIEDAAGVDAAEQYLTSTIQSVIERTVPARRVCAYSRPWWTPELTDLRRRVASTRRRWIRTGRVVDREDFLCTRRLFRRTLERAKRDSWRRLCDDTLTRDFWALYHRIRREGSAAEVEDLVQGDSVLSSDTEKAAALAAVFFPPLPESGGPRHHAWQHSIEHAWSTH